MIAMEQVIRCDVTTTIIARNLHRHQARCDRTFPAWSGLEQAWPHAERHGWTQDDSATIDGQARHRCPHHARAAAAGAKQLWWDLRARARSTSERSPESSR